MQEPRVPKIRATPRENSWTRRSLPCPPNARLQPRRLTDSTSRRRLQADVGPPLLRSSNTAVDWLVGVLTLGDSAREFRQTSGRELLGRCCNVLDAPPPVTDHVVVIACRLNPIAIRNGYEESLVLIAQSTVPRIGVSTHPDPPANLNLQASLFPQLATCCLLEALSSPQGPAGCYPEP